jgi:SWI/SNF-related matrix-associated actin-dependent regulator 1 of chromatin subfamily A
MILDFNPKGGFFLLRVPRWECDPQVIMEEHGFDFSTPASTPAEAVLFTREPYAAVAFHDIATPLAQEQLVTLYNEIETSWAISSGAHIKCPADEELWPFQKGGVEYALRRQNSLIGDVPGLGKTAQAICFANEINARRVLVLCPASIRLQWAGQIRRWSTMPWPYHVHCILNGRRGVHPAAEWTVVSYDLARTPAIGGSLAEGSYDLLILDEGHYLKTIDAGRTRAVFGGGKKLTHPPLAGRSGAIIDLTGTPLPNRPREAYTALRGLCWDAIDFMSEDTFGERFNPVIRRKITKLDGTEAMVTDERTGRHGELQSRLRANIMVRRMKHGPRGVMTQLKLPLFDIVHMEETGPVKAALRAESMLDIDPEALDGADAEVLGAVATVRRLMGEALAPQAAAYTAMLLDGGEDKILLYAYHKSVIAYLARELNRYGVIVVDGSTGAIRKQEAVNDFQNIPGKRVFLGQLLAIGTGTDGLQLATARAVFAEADWTPGNNQQGIDRLDRGGQTGQVQADFLVARGSFSEKILAKSLRKGRVTDKALDRRMVG